MCLYLVITYVCVCASASVLPPAQVIELNPFMETTDGCLYSWQKERHILEHGPFECRVRDRPPKGARSLISHDWRPLLDLQPIKLQ